MTWLQVNENLKRCTLQAEGWNWGRGEEPVDFVFSQFLAIRNGQLELGRGQYQTVMSSDGDRLMQFFIVHMERIYIEH